jgi:hypothetical protein
MLKRKPTSPARTRDGSARPDHRAGRTVLTGLAGASVLGAAATAAALAGLHTAAWGASVEQCAQLCVSVQVATGTAAPGQTVPFSIQISPASPLDEVAAKIAVASNAGSPGFPAPTFTSCGDGDGTHTCTVGLLQADQTTDLRAQVLVPGNAHGGSTATLSVTVTWSLLGLIGTGSATAAGTVEIVAPPPTSSPPPSSPPPSSPPPSSPPPVGTHPTAPPRRGHSDSPGSGGGGSSPGGQHQSTALATSLPGFRPGVTPLLSAGGSVSAADPAGLFPMIYPLPSSAHRKKISRGAYRATAVADVLPLSIRQLDTEVAGLIVLAFGVVLAVVRVPLRQHAPGLNLRVAWTHARSRASDARSGYRMREKRAKQQHDRSPNAAAGTASSRARAAGASRYEPD